MQHGMWVDDSPRLVLDPRYFDRAADLGIKTLAIMVESSRDGFDPTWSERELDRARFYALARDMELVLTIWPTLFAKYHDELEARIGGLLDAAGAAALDCDAESNFRERPGSMSKLEAAQRLGALFDSLRTKRDVRIEVDTFADHPENGPHAVLATRSDRIIGQAYSVCYRKNAAGVDELVPWDGPLGPGGMQKHTFERSKLIPTHPPISAGLAAYQQSWPGRKPQDAMAIAYTSSLAYAPREVRWWSAKWIIGSQANGYAADFIKSVAKTST